MENKEYDICKKYPVGEFDVTGEWIPSSSDINFTFEDDWAIANILSDKIYELDKEYKDWEAKSKDNPELKFIGNNIKQKIERYSAIRFKMMKFFYLLNCEEKLYSYNENQI